MNKRRSKQQPSTSSHPSEHPKNLQTTNKASKTPHRNFFKRYRSQLLIALLCLSVFAVATYIFYRRFPNNYDLPNFYAEDGNKFAENVLNKGVWGAIFTTFNGYYIAGIYVLHALAMVVNHLFYHNEFVNLPRSIALVSYGFFGMVATLPIILFRNYVKPAVLAFLVLMIAFVPIVESDYAVLGVIGNLKFAFIFIAFMLMVYRHLMPKNTKLVYLIDLGILICAYTNITVYALMPFALLRYWPEIRKLDYKALIKNRTFQSLVGLGFLMLYQLYIVKTHGIPELPGYLDTGFRYNRTVEIFVSRSYLYDLLFPINKALNDIIVVVIALLLGGLGLVFGGKYRSIFLFGIYAVFISTFLFVVKRTGISEFYFGYKSGGPDQFFYPQNWIFGFVIVLTLGQALYKLKDPRIRWVLYSLFLAVIIFLYAPRASSYGKNNFENLSIQTIYQQAHDQCLAGNKDVTLSVYPSPKIFLYEVTRQEACTPTALNYNPPVEDLGLESLGVTYAENLGITNFVTQTFVSPRKNLSGVSVYFSTFMKQVHTPYGFTLYDKTCKNILASIKIDNEAIKDNDFHKIHFPKQANSANQTYCFSVASTQAKNIDPLAIQLSAPDIYEKGDLTFNGQPMKTDLVFRLLYN